MALPSPSNRKPTASEVAAWAKSRIGKRVDVDGRYGPQCWDLPNYIFKRYWGFTTWGNAVDMAYYKYPKGFKFYRNTTNFVPLPGDIAVWHPGNGIGYAGHTAIVVGPSDTKTFRSVDQNWVHPENPPNFNMGSAGAYVTHGYASITGFVRPAYHKEATPPKVPAHIKPTVKPVDSTATTVDGEAKKPKFKEVTKVQYTSFNEEDDAYDSIQHYVVTGDTRTKQAKGIYVKESTFFREVSDIYKQRNKYTKPEEYPHAYVDRETAWHCRHTDNIVPSHPEWLVLEVCGARTANKQEYLYNIIQAIIYGLQMLNWENIKLSKDTVKLDTNIWRTMKDMINFDMIMNGIPENAKYEDVKNKILDSYNKRDKLLTETIITTTTKTKVKLKNSNAGTVTVNKIPTGVKASEPKLVVKQQPKTVVEKSPFTFSQALNKQMNVYPQISNGWGWYNASRSQTSNAMNPNKIWNSSTQKYQMLNLGKYQGIPVAKLNQILKGKGTLSGQGKAFSDACRQYNLNEIYLISHAFLESGNGTSNFASGRYGIYNYFGIGAYDSNPDNAIPYARNRGWTTPSKGIKGGAKFVRKDFIDKGQNTLYRMRWNPKHPATHQYATDINWCNHQASNIASLYSKIGIKGIYYTQDKYK